MYIDGTSYVQARTSDALFRLRDVRTSDICNVPANTFATRTDATANRKIIIARASLTPTSCETRVSAAKHC